MYVNYVCMCYVSKYKLCKYVCMYYKTKITFNKLYRLKLNYKKDKNS